MNFKWIGKYQNKRQNESRGIEINQNVIHCCCLMSCPFICPSMGLCVMLVVVWLLSSSLSCCVFPFVVCRSFFCLAVVYPSSVPSFKTIGFRRSVLLLHEGFLKRQHENGKSLKASARGQEDQLLGNVHFENSWQYMQQDSILLATLTGFRLVASDQLVSS